METNTLKKQRTDDPTKHVSFAEPQIKPKILSPREEKAAYDAGYSFMEQYPTATSEQINISAKGYSDAVIFKKKFEEDKKFMQAGRLFAQQNPNATKSEIDAHFKLTMNFLNSTK